MLALLLKFQGSVQGLKKLRLKLRVQGCLLAAGLSRLETGSKNRMQKLGGPVSHQVVGSCVSWLSDLEFVAFAIRSLVLWRFA